MKTLKLSLALICLALCTGISFAQVPGDGIPDVYLVHPNGTTFPTSVGDITRPAGTILVDTDGTDMVTLLLTGPDLIGEPANPALIPDDGNWLWGNTARLPDPNADPPLFNSAWGAIGFINNQSQWVRTDPLDTDGFVGVIGEYDDPFSIFPNLGLAPYGDGTGAGDFGNVTYATSASGTYTTDGSSGLTMGGVTPTWIIPEPATMSLFGMAILGLIGLRRRS